MDPVNERRVFDLIVRTASQRKTAQYFLLSPKVSGPHSKGLSDRLGSEASYNHRYARLCMFTF